MKITGAELFVNALKKEHVDTLFAYPGGQAIDLFDALYGENEIHMVMPRHEQGRWYTRRMVMHVLPGRSVSVWSQAVPEQQFLLRCVKSTE